MRAAVGTPKRLPDMERFNRRDFGHLEVQVTIDDPQASTKPRSFPLQFEFLADTQTCATTRKTPCIRCET